MHGRHPLSIRLHLFAVIDGRTRQWHPPRLYGGSRIGQCTDFPQAVLFSRRLEGCLDVLGVLPWARRRTGFPLISNSPMWKKPMFGSLPSVASVMSFKACGP